jgi:transposase
MCFGRYIFGLDVKYRIFMAWRSIPKQDGIRALEEFTSKTKDKLEYIRGRALVLRAQGKNGDEVARELGVSRGSVYEWESRYAKSGIDGLRRKYSTGRPPVKKTKAMKIIPQLMKKDPKLFGFLKGRWVVRDIAKEIEKETGIGISKTHVERMLQELDLSYKRPKLHVKSDDPNYYRKKREVRSYQRIAPALEKKGF